MKSIVLLILLLAFNSNAQTDKVAHFGVGYVASATTTAICQRYEIRHPVLLGIAVGTVLGIGKEAYDKYSGKGTPSYGDAFSTIGGSVLGSFTVKISIPLMY